MSETIIIKDKRSTMKALAYLSPIILIGVSVVAMIPVIVAMGLEPPMSVLLGVTFAAEAVAIGFVLLIVGKKSNRLSLMGLRGFSFKSIVSGVIIGSILMIALQLFGKLGELIGNPIESSETSQMLTSLSGFEKFFVLVLGISLLAPILEELFFRGYVLGFLLGAKDKLETTSLRDKSVWWPIMFSSIFFGFMHFQGLSSVSDAFVLLWTALLGVILAVARIKTGSIWTSIFIHIVYNSITAAIVLIVV